MVKGNNAKNDNVKTKEDPNKITEGNKDDPFLPNRKESTKNDKLLEEATINALQTEIDNLKKKVREQDETIDDLVQERDEVSDELFKVRLTLADAWNIQRNTNHEKIWEVLRRTREYSQTQGEQKKYSRVVQSGNKDKAADSTAQMNESNLTKCSSINSVDSGLGMESITQLIDERINLILDTKLTKQEQLSMTNINQVPNEDTNLAPIHGNLDEKREQNIIIHGLKEDEECDTKIIKDLFAATATQHEPVHMMRLGSKNNNDKIRPVMLRMKNQNEKDEFMSKLWMLKNMKIRYGNISITDDYTQEERHLIKKWVNEAARRNANGTNGYRWKVRGTPRKGMRLVLITNQE